MLSKGLAYEQLAKKHLMENGLRYITSNYRVRNGEIDLIMKDCRTLVFVEVRYRKTIDYGTPGESITTSKQKRIISTAQHFLNTKKLWHYPCRFDVVLVTAASSDKLNELTWIKSAFDNSITT